MKKVIVLVSLLALAGCVEEPVVTREQIDEAPPAEYSDKILEAEKEAQRRMALMTVREAVEGYRLFDAEKRYPVALSQVVSAGLIASLPELPPGYSFSYDPVTGKVDLVGGEAERSD